MIDDITDKIKKDELVRGSLILFIMLNIFNILNYIFHFSMARLLGPRDYGILAVLFSFIYIFTIPSESIQNIIASYTSKLNLKKEDGRIKFLFLKSINKGMLFSFLTFLFFIPVAYFLSGFIRVDFGLLIMTGIFIFLFTLIPILRGVLQGQKKFVNLGANMILEGLLKLVLGLVMVLIGWKVYGAIFSVILSIVLAFIIGIFSIKNILKSKKEKSEFDGIYHYSIPYFFAIISITLMYSIDIIFAKRFFNEELAGIYAVASILGKIIFFGTSAVGKTMLPLISEKYENGEKTHFILKKSLKIVGLLSLIILLSYLFFPKLIITALFGEKYLDASSIIFILGLGLSFLSLTNIFLLYNLSTKGIKKSYFLLGFVVIEILLFYYFHSNLMEFYLAFLSANFIFMVISLLFLTHKKCSLLTLSILMHRKQRHFLGDQEPHTTE